MSISRAPIGRPLSHVIYLCYRHMNRGRSGPFSTSSLSFFFNGSTVPGSRMWYPRIGQSICNCHMSLQFSDVNKFSSEISSTQTHRSSQIWNRLPGILMWKNVLKTHDVVCIKATRKGEKSIGSFHYTRRETCPSGSTVRISLKATFPCDWTV